MNSPLDLPPEKPPQSENENKQYLLPTERLRGWSLTALHFSLFILLSLVVVGLFIFWPELSDGKQFQVIALLIVCSAAALANLQSSLKFIKALKQYAQIPGLHLIPFGLAFAALAIATRVFATANG